MTIILLVALVVWAVYLALRVRQLVEEADAIREKLERRLQALAGSRNVSSRAGGRTT
jgi:hypothetical protein